MRKAVEKKQDDVSKRLKALHEKLNSEQLTELRCAQNTYTLKRSKDGLGMSINAKCEIDAVARGSLAEVRLHRPTASVYKMILKISRVTVTLGRQLDFRSNIASNRSTGWTSPTAKL